MSENIQQTPIEPPKTGLKSVRFAVFIVQLIVSFIFMLLIRRNILDAETAERLKSSPELLLLKELAAQGLTYLFLLAQAWVASVFIKVSGQFAIRKTEIIGDYQKQVVLTSGAPASTSATAEQTNEPV